ncbi:MAG: hypothetical protein KC619_34990, partial [Myxococcales bacterium]|nr:hypothetical protein [Myxococcales bacterium]
TKSLRELTPPGPKLTPAEAAAATAQARLAAATAIAQATPQGLWAAVAAAAAVPPPPTWKGERLAKDVGKWGGDATTPVFDPIFQLDAIQLKGIVQPSDQTKDLKHGFSEYFSRLDPYSIIDTAPITNVFAKALATYMNVMTWIRRTMDVAFKYGVLVEDNLLVKRAIGALDALDKLGAVTKQIHALGGDLFGYWMKDPSSPPTGGRDLPVVGGFVDAAKSGFGSRFGAPDGIAQAALAQEGASAKIESNDGPFDLSARPPAEWELSIHTEHPAHDHVFTLEQLEAVAAAGTPAALPVTASLDAVVPAFRADVTDLVHERHVSPGEVLDWAARRLGVPVADHTICRPRGSVVRAHLRTPATLNDETHELTAGAATMTLRFGDVLTLTRIDQQRQLTLRIDGAEVRVPLDSAQIDQLDDARGKADVRAIFAAAVGTAGRVGEIASDAFTIETFASGTSATIEVVDGAGAAATALGLALGDVASGTDPAAVTTVDYSSVTAEALAALLGAVEGLTASVAERKLVLESSAKARLGEDSVVTVEGTLADELFATKTSTETLSAFHGAVAVEAGAWATWEQLLGWASDLKSLPADAKKLAEPVVAAIDDVVGFVQKVEETVEAATDIVSGNLKKGLPEPGEAIGIIANQGITLGTQDRIVGTGGKGIVFIADGGTGTENHDKFVPLVEGFVNDAIQWDPLDKAFESLIGGTKDGPDKDQPPSLGFRTYSDSVVDLFGTYASQLMALGRGKVAATATRDGETDVGVGIARVAGSHAVDIAGYRRVVVSARNRGDDDKTGGRLDLLGQTIFLGGFNGAPPLPAVPPTGAPSLVDFKDDKEGLGLAPLDLVSLAGHEHVEDDPQKGNPLTTLKDTIKAYGWTKELRTNHPNTNYVRIHAAKETTMVVGGFMIHLDAAQGLSVGTRKDVADPASNTLDTAKAQLTLDAGTITFLSKEAGTEVSFGQDDVKLQQGSATGPLVHLNENAATFAFDASKTFVKLTSSRSTIKHDQTVLSLKPSGANFQATDLRLNGQSIKLG